MKPKLEEVIILLVIAAFIITSVSSLITIPDPSTREGAIEISKQGRLVKMGLARLRSFTIEAQHLNASTVEQLKRGHLRVIYEKVPEGHSVWNLTWWFKYNERIGAYSVIIVIDSETGAIIHEEMGIALRRNQ